MNLVIGATGILGSEICRLLTVNDQPVRAMIRETSDPEKTARLESMGVQLVKGDLRNPDSFKNVLNGIKVIFTTTSAIPFSYISGENDLQNVDLEGMKNLINHAAKAGIKRFIYTSFSGNIDLDFQLRNVKREVENYLKKSGMVYTILRPSCFMEVWLSSAVGFDAANAKVQIFGDGTNPVSYISYKDVARFAMECLNNPNARKAVLELGGPEKISQLDVIKIFEKINGRKFEIQHLPVEALKSRLDALTDPLEKSFTALMLCVANGDPIDMKTMLEKYPVKLTSVKEYAKSMVAVL